MAESAISGPLFCEIFAVWSSVVGEFGLHGCTRRRSFASIGAIFKQLGDTYWGMVILPSFRNGI